MAGCAEKTTALVGTPGASSPSAARSCSSCDAFALSTVGSLRTRGAEKAATPLAAVRCAAASWWMARALGRLSGARSVGSIERKASGANAARYAGALLPEALGPASLLGPAALLGPAPLLEPAAVALAYCLDENPVLKQVRL